MGFQSVAYTSAASAASAAYDAAASSGAAATRPAADVAGEVTTGVEATATVVALPPAARSCALRVLPNVVPLMAAVSAAELAWAAAAVGCETANLTMTLPVANKLRRPVGAAESVMEVMFTAVMLTLPSVATVCWNAVCSGAVKVAVV